MTGASFIPWNTELQPIGVRNWQYQIKNYYPHWRIAGRYAAAFSFFSLIDSKSNRYIIEGGR